MMTIAPRIRLLLPALLALAACGTADADTAPEAAPVVVDSARPRDESIRRYQAESGPAPAGLRGAPAPSADSLVARFAAAVARSDTAALAAMVMDQGEFAHFFYAGSPQSLPPYELPPEIMWLQLSQQSERGFPRLMEHFGGSSAVRAEGWSCAREARQGADRVWSACTVRVMGETAPVPLFGGIWEHGGAYKFVSYANDL
ncbi:MAG TPA: hypothetical protein VF665_12790 [Longimicrobium sp.]|jgi:hypothetical protein|uniref:hypothetical protein n=1 Tax=Longimicrobium sp. TaxID=2029185 RepID=UPI002ED939D2